jgi:DNA polymerase III subunit epsilon
MTFTSIDFETANHSRASICAAGLAVFEDGALTESLYWLVRPPKGHGWFREDFTECHGLTWFDVQDAPEFPAIAPVLLERLTRSDFVVAHNAQFDIGALQATLSHFGLPCPAFDYLCTYRLSARIWPDLPDHKLSTLAARIGFQLNYHHAQSDAEAAGRVLLAMMKQLDTKTPADFSQRSGVAVRNSLREKCCQEPACAVSASPEVLPQDDHTHV